ncbi:Methyltransferase ausD [Sparassis crispa]|uniref:Methyltransferase ausD n=1 Tax=Sparassis crispa TaxID=139825 RepID=A0A401H4K4_9APHY|nr:Methyltransferase ausD [Sparassis crispa]GBE89376.1 Methyltransferase ausD [Sparassis crispa]
MAQGKADNTISNVLENTPLDDSFYDLDRQELAFFQSQTGIQDEAALKAHISKIQADAYDVWPLPRSNNLCSLLPWQVHPYPCIRRFAFTKLKMSRLPAYGQLLKLGKERKGAIFLDIGCCFGNDVRKAIVDGYPIENAIASDLEADFWRLGHQLFTSTAETFPVPFLPGDAFNADFLKPVPPFYAPPETPRPDLRSLTTLTPLLGHVSAIHASSFFHLFDEEQQLQLARSVAGLLSPEPGSVIFGAQGGCAEKGPRVEVPGVKPIRSHMFRHSPESWTELWDGTVFEKGKVKVEASLYQMDSALLKREGSTLTGMVWSVTRL